MSLWRRLVPSLLCLGMALVPLFALGGGGSGAGTTVSVAVGDPLAGRQIVDRASRSAPLRSLNVAYAATSAQSAPAATDATLAVSRRSTGASIASAAAARPVGLVRAPAARRLTANLPPAPRHTPAPPPRPTETGGASWYEAPAGTCAHPWLALGTVVTVTDLATGQSTTCRVADRGPYAEGRIIDLSEVTFAKLESASSGVIEVRITW